MIETYPCWGTKREREKGKKKFVKRGSSFYKAILIVIGSKLGKKKGERGERGVWLKR